MQKLPPSISYKEILEALATKYKVSSLIKKDKPIEGKKSDPAHPSIYPTGEHAQAVLPEQEQKLYDLIVRRFLSLFMEDAVIENKTIDVSLNSGKDEKQFLEFIRRGAAIKKKSWLGVYPAKVIEKEVLDAG